MSADGTDIPGEGAGALLANSMQRNLAQFAANKVAHTKSADYISQINTLQIELWGLVVIAIITVGGIVAATASVVGAPADVGLIPAAITETGEVTVVVGEVASLSVVTLDTIEGSAIAIEASAELGPLLIEGSVLFTTDEMIDFLIRDIALALFLVSMAPDATTPGKPPITGPDGLPISPIADPYPIDPRTKALEKNRDCSQVAKDGTELYGQGIVEQYQTEHPGTWCTILGSLEDIDNLTGRSYDGLYTLQSYLRQGDSSTWAQGAFFELQWLHDHLSSVSAIEPNDPNGNQGVDAMDSQGNYIDFKSVKSDNMSARIDDWKRQILSDLRKYSSQIPPHKVRIIFDGSKLARGVLPNSVLKMFADIEAQVPPNQKNAVEFLIWTPGQQM